MSGAAERVTKLGETELTAYRGDRGKLAYDHSQETGNPHGTTTADISDFSEALQAALANSPALGGTPTAPTASLGTNTTQIATTAFVVAELQSRLSNINGGAPDTVYSLTYSGGTP